MNEQHTMAGREQIPPAAARRLRKSRLPGSTLVELTIRAGNDAHGS